MDPPGTLEIRCYQQLFAFRTLLGHRQSPCTQTGEAVPVATRGLGQLLAVSPPLEGDVFEGDGRLAGVRQGMRIRDEDGKPVGFVREVSGRSVLVGEGQGKWVYWIDADRVAGVVDGEVRLGSAAPVGAESRG